MLTDKIELAEFPPIEDYAESLYSFRAEDYTDIQANEPPNNPYFICLSTVRTMQHIIRHMRRFSFRMRSGKAVIRRLSGRICGLLACTFLESGS